MTPTARYPAPGLSWRSSLTRGSWICVDASADVGADAVTSGSRPGPRSADLAGALGVAPSATPTCSGQLSASAQSSLRVASCQADRRHDALGTLCGKSCPVTIAAPANTPT